MSKIIITESGNIDAESKEKLIESGYVIIEAKDPCKVKLVGEIDISTGNDFFMAALIGSADNSMSRENFFKELVKRLDKIQTPQS